MPTTTSILLSSIWPNDARLEINHVCYPASLAQARHAHDHASLSILLRGSLQEQHGRHCEQAQTLSVVVKSAGASHADVYGPSGCESIQIRLPAGSPYKDVLPAEGSLRWHHHGGEMVAAMLALAQLVTKHTTARPEDLRNAVWEALAVVDPHPLLPGAPPNWLMWTKEHIDDASRTPSVQCLAREADVHPVYLTRMFKRHFGCSIRSYLKAKRLKVAVNLLSDGRITVTEIAHRLGYTDHAHLCRDFRTFAGINPSSLARIIRHFEREPELRKT